MCMALTFSMLYLYVVATLTALMTSVDMRNVLYRENMDKVSLYLNSKSLPRALHLKVLRYFEHFYGKHATVSNEAEILANLDTKLRRDVASVLSNATFKKTHLFSDFHEDVHLRLLPILRPVRAEKGERVFEAGSFGTEIFIVRHGHVRGQVPDVTKHLSSRGLFNARASGIRKKWKNAMSKAKAISQMQNVVKELGEKNMDGVFTYDDTSCFCTGYLYEFTENSVFGEFAALHILPKRIYDAVSMCETELFSMRRKDLLDSFTGPDRIDCK